MSRPATESLRTIFRFASPYIPASARQCARNSRPFSSPRTLRQSSKRQLQTATVYRPHSFPTDLPPPLRNVGIPESSIAGGVAGVDRRSTGEIAGHSEHEIESSSEIKGDLQRAKSESERQQEAPSQQALAATTRPRKSKLRPRKAAMSLSPKAVSHLRKLLDQPDPKLIRVGVKNRGCSGLAYHLEYVDKPGAFDETVEQDGVKVLIDSKALFSIIGSEMDWIEDKLNERFVFKNPNITEQCGCGESFSIS